MHLTFWSRVFAEQFVENQGSSSTVQSMRCIENVQFNGPPVLCKAIIFFARF